MEEDIIVEEVVDLNIKKAKKSFMPNYCKKMHMSMKCAYQAQD